MCGVRHVYSTVSHTLPFGRKDSCPRIQYFVEPASISMASGSAAIALMHGCEPHRVVKLKGSNSFVALDAACRVIVGYVVKERAAASWRLVAAYHPNMPNVCVKYPEVVNPFPAPEQPSADTDAGSLSDSTHGLVGSASDEHVRLQVL